jgi:hypothetical protein
MVTSYPATWLGMDKLPNPPNGESWLIIAVQFVINYEEGEKLVFCTRRPNFWNFFLSEILSYPAPLDSYMNMEPCYEYGSRAEKLWRLYEAVYPAPYPRHGTFAVALERNPERWGDVRGELEKLPMASG